MQNTYKPEGLIMGTYAVRELLSLGRVGIERAMQTGMILESTALMCDEEMNLHVDLRGMIGIIPRSEVCYHKDGAPVKDIAIITRVGKPVCFKVIGIEERNGSAVAILSRREAQKECMRNFISDLIPGDIVCSRVTHLEPFGAFVDVGCGIVSLLSVDCISVSRFTHPRDRLSCGMVISTVVRSLDPIHGRIFVSLRELLGTWEENAAMFSAGQTVTGIIRSVESYGIFVELAPNLAGLAELRGDVVESIQRDGCGKTAAVFIKSIIPERMKIKLVVVDTCPREAEAPRIKYFVDTEKVTHIDRWQYSPQSCARVIETVFHENF